MCVYGNMQRNTCNLWGWISLCTVLFVVVGLCIAFDLSLPVGKHLMATVTEAEAIYWPQISVQSAMKEHNQGKMLISAEPNTNNATFN